MLRGKYPAICAAVLGVRASRVCCDRCAALLDEKLPGRRSCPAAAAASAVAADPGPSEAAVHGTTQSMADYISRVGAV